MINIEKKYIFSILKNNYLNQTKSKIELSIDNRSIFENNQKSWRIFIRDKFENKRNKLKERPNP